MEQKLICVDIETSTWFDQPHIKPLPRELQIAAMELGCAVTWDNTREGSSFWYNNEFDILTLPDDIMSFEAWEDTDTHHLWDYLKSFEIIIGWNIISFDLPIIARAAGATIGAKFPQIFDLFAIIKQVTGRWYKLQDVAYANLGRGKTADGLQAAKWLAQGEFLKAVEYCRVDVELERDLCLLALKNHPIKLPVTSKFETEMLLTIDWDNRSYFLGGKL